MRLLQLGDWTTTCSVRSALKVVAGEREARIENPKTVDTKTANTKTNEMQQGDNNPASTTEVTEVKHKLYPSTELLTCPICIKDFCSELRRVCQCPAGHWFCSDV